jgi:HK97 family phage major capsid protein
MDIKNLRRQRAAYYRDMQAIVNAIGDTGMTEEQRQKYEEAERAFDNLTDQIELAEVDGTCAVLDGTGRSANRDLDTRDGHVLGERSLRSWTAERGLSDGYTAEEVDGFSLAKCVRGLASGNWTDAELERRALGSGSDATGGVLVPAPLAATVIDMVRDESRVIEAGASLVPMTSGTLSIPRLASGFDQATWRSELEDVAAADGTFERVSFDAKTLAEIVTLPYELVEDMTSEGSAIIEAAIRKALGLKLDWAALYGAEVGSGDQKNPIGVRNQDGVTVAAIDTNGAVPTTYAPFTTAAFALRKANHTPTGYIYSERTAETVASFADTTGQPLNPPRAIADLPHLSTNQVPDNLDVGTSTDACSDIFTADWSQLLIGVRPQLGIRVERHNVAGNMSVQILAYLRADVQLAHAAAFHVTEGILEPSAE